MQPIPVFVGEPPRLDLELIVPIAPTHAFKDIAGQGQGARLPLFENVAILVQHKPRVLKKVSSVTAQVDASAAGGGNGAAMKTHEQRMLDDPDVSDLLPEQQLQ